MFLGILFILASILFGLAVLTYLRVEFCIEEQVSTAIPIGLVASTLLIYLVSYSQKNLNFTIISLMTIFLIIISLGIFKRQGKLNKTLLSNKRSRELSLVVLAGVLAFLVLNVNSILRPTPYGLASSEFGGGDLSFHISVINSFVFRNNFPPYYPVMIDTPMKYPIPADFLSSILVTSGFDLRSSIIIPNLLFQVALFCLIASLAIRLTRKKYVGILSAFIMFFAGNMGIIFALKDVFRTGDIITWISKLPTDYAGSGITKIPGLYFGNPVSVMLMPQRSSMMGMSIALIVYILMIHVLKKDGQLRELMLAGVLTGILPTIHTHSFIAVVIVLVGFTIIFKKNWRFFGLLFLPIILLALPQLLNIQTQVSNDFFGFSAGWLGSANSKLQVYPYAILNVLSSVFVGSMLFVSFWALNLGSVIILFFVGFFKSTRRIKQFFLPFLLLFLLGNFVRFQPWNWDNYKLFLHWYIIFIIIASLGVIELAKILRGWFQEKIICTRKDRLKKSLGWSVLIILVVTSTASGFLSHMRTVQEGYVLWSESDLLFAEWVKENTDPDAIFLTSSSFTHPVGTLAGRQIVLGYEGWLWSHGIQLTQIQTVKEHVIAMYKGNYSLIEMYNVGFISVTKYERNLNVNRQFLDSKLFTKVYEGTLNGENYLLFKVL